MSGTVKVTLDYNCLVDLDQNRSSSSDIQEIIKLNDLKQVILIVPGIGASERKKGTQGTAHFFNEFTDTLTRHKIPNACISYPFARTDMTYADASFFAPENPCHKILEWEVHQILHPEWEYNYQAHIQITKYSEPQVDLKWLNRICDTLTMCCHLENKADLFVTGDMNYYKETKLPKLIALGAGHIATASDAVKLIKTHSIPDSSRSKVEYVRVEEGEVVHIPSAYEHYSKWYHDTKASKK